MNIDGISSCIHIDSPRIRVLTGPPHVRIFDICCDTEQVSAKRDALVAKRTLRQQEYDRLVDTAARLHISHTPARPHTVNVHVHGLAKDSESMDSLDLPSSKATREVDELIRTLILHMRIASDAIQTLDRQILELEHQLSVPRELRKGDGSTVITATVLAEEECEVTLQLTYRESTSFRTSAWISTHLSQWSAGHGGNRTTTLTHRLRQMGDRLRTSPSTNTPGSPNRRAKTGKTQRSR